MVCRPATDRQTDREYYIDESQSFSQLQFQNFIRYTYVFMYKVLQRAREKSLIIFTQKRNCERIKEKVCFLSDWQSGENQGAFPVGR